MRFQLWLAKCTSKSMTSRKMLEALRLSLKGQQEPFQSDSKKPRGAVAVLFKEEAEDLWLLMIKRGENPRDPWSGQMAFPGGHADAQDRTLLDTVARECSEEVGINIRDQEFLGCLHNVEPRNAPMLVTPFVFLGKSILPRVEKPKRSFGSRYPSCRIQRTFLRSRFPLVTGKS
jgi:ADP-ribose pyrophosphatase YjhB (NUDIX family)